MPSEPGFEHLEAMFELPLGCSLFAAIKESFAIGRRVLLTGSLSFARGYRVSECVGRGP